MASYSDPGKQILVTGFPRSGNTWLSRLLGDTLNSPVTGYMDAKPLCSEGQRRTGQYVVRQLHLRPMYDYDCPDFLPSAYRANVPKWNEEKVVHIFRDPRDVAVSLMHYWDRPSVEDAVQVMIDGSNPVKVHGKWLVFVKEWLAVMEMPVVHTTYELLKSNPLKAMRAVLDHLHISYREEMLEQAIERQAFDKKREHIKAHGADYNYGRSVQLKAMRKGITGDWRNHFTPKAAELAHQEWGEFLLAWGYETDKDWWKNEFKN